jgi:hypothetical protein
MQGPASGRKPPLLALLAQQLTPLRTVHMGLSVALVAAVQATAAPPLRAAGPADHTSHSLPGPTMWRSTSRLALLLVSALYVSGIRHPLSVLEPVEPTTLVGPQAAAVESVPTASTAMAQETASTITPNQINAATSQAAVDALPWGAVLTPEALTRSGPTAAAADVASTAVDSVVVAPVATSLPVESTAGDAGVSAQAAIVTPPAVVAYAAKTLGVSYSGSGFLVSEGPRC